jgi:hypothetical protein
MNTVGGGAEMSDMIDMSQLRQMMGDVPMGTSQMEFGKAPLFFKRTLLFPYLDGMVFVDGLKKKGGWALVNKAFKDLPKSTEQILHVDRYLMKDNPVIISWPELSKKMDDWQMVEENTAGELVINTYFENFLPSSDEKAIGEGWGGDKYRVYTKGKDNFLVWFVTWDRNQDAKQFFENYILLLQKKYSQLRWDKKVPQKAYLGKVGTTNCYLGINGKDVLIVEKCPEKMTTDLVKTAWLARKQK